MVSSLRVPALCRSPYPTSCLAQVLGFVFHSPHMLPSKTKPLGHQGLAYDPRSLTVRVNFWIYTFMSFLALKEWPHFHISSPMHPTTDSLEGSEKLTSMASTQVPRRVFSLFHCDGIYWIRMEESPCHLQKFHHDHCPIVTGTWGPHEGCEKSGDGTGKGAVFKSVLSQGANVWYLP